MFEINVHRETLEQKRRARQGRVRALFIQTIYVALLALFTGVFTLHLLVLHERISAKEDELRKVGELLASYEPSNGGVSLEKVHLVSKIKGGQPKWGEKLQVLSSLLPPQMWLTEIHLTEETVEGALRDALLVSGSTYITEEHNALDTIVEFLNALRDDKSFSEDFESIKLLSSRRSASLEKEELNFKFICLIRR